MTFLMSPSSRLLVVKGLLGNRGTFGVSRFFSGDCEPVRRLRNAIAEYRERNYTMELPSRFKKELFHPYAINGSVQVEQLNALLVNIGHSESCLSSQEMNELLREAGSNGRGFSMKQIMDLIG